MRYFEIQQPYYALIAAENEEKALEVYTELVSDIDDEETFYDEMKEIDKADARALFITSKDEDGNYPTVEDLENIKNNVLLIDRSLI